MPAKDYYVVLGVPRTETLAGIRSAYRALARRYHPDYAGEQATPTFQEITDAYEALSDPQRRRDHNQNLRQAEEIGGWARTAQAAAWPAAEPLVPDRWPSVSILDDPGSIRPSFEALRERLMRNFTGVGVPKSEAVEGLNMDLVLTPGEAAQGVVVAIGVPTVHRCPVCDGSGVDWAYPCAFCGHQGVVTEEEVVRVRIPPLVRPGTILEIPLESLGIRNLFLRFHVSITAEPLASLPW
jgi:molecular chaperone DnaJ